jgi:DNA-binding CsgD family transcriptional regulator
VPVGGVRSISIGFGQRNDRRATLEYDDARTPMSWIADLYDAIDEDDGYARSTLAVVSRLVSSDVSSFSHTQLRDPATQFAVWPRPTPAHRHRISDFDRLHDDHPLITRFDRSIDPPPTMWTDVVDLGEFERTELHAVYYGPIGIRHQLAVKVGGTPGVVVSIALNRTGPFTEDDRQRLAEALPHLRRAYRLVERLRAAEDRGAPLGADALQHSGLTPRQVEVALALSAGGTNAEVAARLGIRVGTLRKHLERVYLALGVDNRTAAVAEARRLTGR